jgi:hypothetical protein
MLAQRQLFVIIKRDFRDREIKKKTSDKSIFVKSHFGDRERIRRKDLGQIHIRKSHFEDEERLRRKERDFGKI